MHFCSIARLPNFNTWAYWKLCSKNGKTHGGSKKDWWKDLHASHVWASKKSFNKLKDTRHTSRKAKYFEKRKNYPEMECKEERTFPFYENQQVEVLRINAVCSLKQMMKLMQSMMLSPTDTLPIQCSAELKLWACCLQFTQKSSLLL